MNGSRYHMCEECDVAWGSFGFEIAYLDEAGNAQSVQLWFCETHRATGENLWAKSRETLQPRDRERPRPAQRVPTQESFDL